MKYTVLRDVRERPSILNYLLYLNERKEEIGVIMIGNVLHFLPSSSSERLHQSVLQELLPGDSFELVKALLGNFMGGKASPEGTQKLISALKDVLSVRSSAFRTLLQIALQRYTTFFSNLSNIMSSQVHVYVLPGFFDFPDVMTVSTELLSKRNITVIQKGLLPHSCLRIGMLGPAVEGDAEDGLSSLYFNVVHEDVAKEVDEQANGIDILVTNLAINQVEKYVPSVLRKNRMVICPLRPFAPKDENQMTTLQDATVVEVSSYDGLQSPSYMMELINRKLSLVSLPVEVYVPSEKNVRRKGAPRLRLSVSK